MAGVMDPNLVCVVGDTHGVLSRTLDVVERGVDLGAGRYLQVGDFGWYPHVSHGRRFISDLDAYCAASGVRWYFVAGNHDNWDDLDLLTAEGERDVDGSVIIGDALRYMPRPHRWEWEGIRFGALGGAWSIDAEGRIHGLDHWPQEQPSYANAEQLTQGGTLDVLVTHDAPGEVNLSPAARSVNDFGGGEGTRTLIDMVVAQTSPRVMFHGHWHWRHTTTLSGGCRVEGLGDHRDTIDDQSVILDLSSPNLEVTPTASALATRTPWWTP